MKAQKTLSFQDLWSATQSNASTVKQTKLSAKQLRCTRIKLYKNMHQIQQQKRSMSCHPDLAPFVFPSYIYRKQIWDTKKLHVKVRKSSVTYASKLLNCSKADARRFKRNHAYNWNKTAVFEEITNKWLKPLPYDLEKAHQKLTMLRYSKQWHKTPFTLPDNVTAVFDTVDDDYYDTGDYLGTFSDTWEEGAIDHQKSGNGTSRDYKWFIPANSYASHRKSLRDLNYSKFDADFLARQYVREEYKRVCEYGSSWCFMGIICKLYKDGEEIAETSLWGIESDSDKEHLEEIKADLMYEAWHEYLKSV